MIFTLNKVINKSFKQLLVILLLPDYQKFTRVCGEP